MMQNSKVVERFTAHYVFCLGLSRFFSCAHWILQVQWAAAVGGC
jgi:ER lumen protein retaining receptor